MDQQENQQENLLQTQPSNFSMSSAESSSTYSLGSSGEDWGTVTLTAHKPEFLLKINSGQDALITILPNGDIIADSAENASEAGRVFIESMRMHGKPLWERIQQLEEENELLKQKIKTYEVH
jgi:hypothetical protein